MSELLESNAKHVVLFSGPIAAGKTTLSQLLADRLGFCIVSTRELLTQGVQDRRSLQATGADRDKSTAGKWVRDGLVKIQRQSLKEISLVVDSVRVPEQIHWVRETFGTSVKHVHLNASLEALSSRYSSKNEGYQYDEIRKDPIEGTVESLGRYADLVIDTTDLCPEAVLSHVVSYLWLAP